LFPNPIQIPKLLEDYQVNTIRFSNFLAIDYLKNHGYF
jgi:hypothetical protein